MIAAELETEMLAQRMWDIGCSVIDIAAKHRKPKLTTVNKDGTVIC